MSASPPNAAPRPEPDRLAGLPTVAPGEYASASGTWVTDREHGRQFKAVFVKISPPNTLTGTERYLGSGMVKGIGPVYAGRLVKAFGAAVFDIIEQTPKRLREVDGIGAIRARKITSSWADQKIIREIMVFLRRDRLSADRRLTPPAYWRAARHLSCKLSTASLHVRVRRILERSNNSINSLGQAVGA
jgi:exodeoxyribonuclease V alpha subunit